MLEPIQKRRVILFVVITFVIAWLIALIIYATGGLTNSPMVIETLNMKLSTLLLSLGVMTAPAVSNILTRVITHEGKQELWLKPFRQKRAGRYWLASWLLPAVLILLGMVVFFVVYPNYYDSGSQTLMELAKTQQTGITLSPSLILMISLVQGLILAPFLNGLFTFGEEFGWRGYLLPKLLPLGGRKAALVSGAIWGVWHAPMIAMGHNYGVDYAGYPWLGIGMMILFCVLFGVFMAWITLKEGSVWPAVVAHAVLNGVAAFPVMLTLGEPNPILGPFLMGAVAGIPLLLLAVMLLWLPNALKQGELRPYAD
ncbi:MAG: CPBP family intramembrane glutamic endopeptidase [Anaerolineaceae bacterium]